MPLSVSQKAEALLVVRTFVSHKLYDHAQETARDRHIPIVAISHNWSEAKTTLLQSGLGHCVNSVKLPPEPVPANDTLVLRQEVKHLKKQLDEAESLFLDKDSQLSSLSEKVSKLEQVLQQFERRFQEPDPPPIPYPSLSSHSPLMTIVFTP